MNEIMKDFAKVSALLIVVFLTHLAEARILQNAPKFYTIQVGTANNETSPSDFKSLKKYGHIYTELLKDNTKGIFLSGFEDKEAADKTLEAIKAVGFADASLLEKDLTKGKEVFVLQIATRRSYQTIDWAHYQKAGNVVLMFEGTITKVGIGPFESFKTANAQIPTLQELGFQDAFIKKINTSKLHIFNDFDVITTNAALESKNPLPAEYNKPDKTFAEKGEIKNTTIEPVTNVVRTSVKALQVFLTEATNKKLNTDGLFDKNTQAIAKAFSNEDNMYYNFKLLTKYAKPKASTTDDDILIKTIKNIPNDPDKSANDLTKQTAPIAKVYRAYVLLQKNDVAYQNEIDELMNAAIQEAFTNFKGKTTFDYKATYSYKNINQLLQHLAYIQQIEKKVPVPCWLFEKHTDLATKFFAKGNYTIEDCNNVTKSENFTILRAIAQELNPEQKANEAKLLSADRKRAKLLVAPTKIAANEAQDATTWHRILWLGLDDWATKDPLHAKYNTALKLAYHLSWIELEDYFLNKGASKDDANILAIQVLQTIVEPHLSSYTR